MKRTKQITSKSRYDGRQFDESSTLTAALDNSVQHLVSVVGSGDGYQLDEVESIALDIANLCAMLSQREADAEQPPRAD